MVIQQIISAYYVPDTVPEIGDKMSIPCTVLCFKDSLSRECFSNYKLLNRLSGQQPNILFLIKIG